jgi:hypothetical protein
MAIADIPSDFKLNEKQLIQKTCIECNKPHVKSDEIAIFLKGLKYPHYYLDFETFATAIPMFDGTRPYQNIPFQFSLHTIGSEKSEPEHRHFLYQGNCDPRPEFINTLRSALGGGGTVIVYNQSFEEGVLEKLAESYPEYAGWIDEVVSRMADLIIPFRNFSYYHPDQCGSASLKHVLPSLTGISYTGLNIAEGQTASLKFMEAAFGGIAPEDRSKIFADLLEYCGQDTYAMVRIVEELRQAI